jgi:hypothetical protein
MPLVGLQPTRLPYLRPAPNTGPPAWAALPGCILCLLLLCSCCIACDACAAAPSGSVLVQGAGPSARYAHTLSLVANRFLVAMGGNDGKSTLGDAWALDTSEKPYQWRKITDAGEMPCPRCGRGWARAFGGRRLLLPGSGLLRAVREEHRAACLRVQTALALLRAVVGSGSLGLLPGSVSAGFWSCTAA